jgi:DNA-binding transcriptional regulator Cro
MTVDEAIKHFGSPAAFAVAIDRNVRTVAKWKKEGIPLLAQYGIQAITKNALKPDVIPQQERT